MPRSCHFHQNRKLRTSKLQTRNAENSQMGSHANTSHNLKLIDSAFRWGIMQNSPVDAATSAFDLLGGYPAGRIRPDGGRGGYLISGRKRPDRVYWVNPCWLLLIKEACSEGRYNLVHVVKQTFLYRLHFLAMWLHFRLDQTWLHFLAMWLHFWLGQCRLQFQARLNFWV